MTWHFGEKLRTVRERRGLTMKELATLVGISESMVSQIERNKVSPAIDTLLSIAASLDIDLEYLFAEFKREKPVRIVRANERRSVSVPGVRYEQLAAADADEKHGIEALLLCVDVGAERGSREYGHPGRELGIIIEGKALFEIGGQCHELGPGDSLSFESNVPHVLRNVGSTPLVAYWIATPPRIREEQ